MRRPWNIAAMLALAVFLVLPVGVVSAANAWFSSVSSATGINSSTAANGIDGNTATYAEITAGGSTTSGHAKYHMTYPQSLASVNLRFNALNHAGAKLVTFNQSGTLIATRTLPTTSSTQDVTIDTSADGVIRYVQVTSPIGSGVRLYELTATAAPAPILPGAPGGLTAEPGETGIVLTWTAPATGDPPDGYKVYREGTQVGSTAGTTWTDNAVEAGVSYSYTVKAYNVSGESPASATASATMAAPPAPPVVPGPPLNVTATATEAGITITWEQPATGDPPTGYYVQRDGTQIGGNTGLSYTDTTVTPGVSYAYTVKGVNAGGTGPESEAVSALAVAPSEPPGSPENVTVTAGPVRLRVNWNTPTSGGAVEGYNVYRSEEAAPSVSFLSTAYAAGPEGFTLIGSTATPEWLDVGLNPEMQYSYFVTAYNNAGESAGAYSPAPASPDAVDPEGFGFFIDLAGIGAQMTTALSSLGPVALFVAALAIALGVWQWFTFMLMLYTRLWKDPRRARKNVSDFLAGKGPKIRL